MAITVDWPNKVIYIYKTDMTLIQTDPFDVYSLDLNQFRLTLKGLEDNIQGINWPKTHNHNPPFQIGGVELARTVEIVNEYTITFEDDQYAVNLVGANSNVGDRVNLNQVSVRPLNSAGLVHSSAIEFGEYADGIYVDVANTTGRARSGQIYPTGTLRQPTDNLADCMVIATAKGIGIINVIGDLTINSGAGYQDMVFRGQSRTKSSLTVNTAANVTNCEFLECDLQGTLDGGSTVKDSYVGTLNYVNGQITNCGLYGTITLDGSEEAVLANCYTIDQDNPPIIDMGGVGQDLAMPNYSGIVTIKNLTSDTEEVGVGLTGGMIILDSTVTAGTIIISGVGIIVDNSTGTADVNTDGLLNKELITKTQWDTVWLDTGSGNSGTAFPNGTASSPVDNITDALAIASANSIMKIHIHGSITLTGAVNGYTIESHSTDSASVNMNGQSVSSTAFKSVTLTGSASGHFDAIDCNLPSGFTNINCSLDNCTMAGTFVVASGETLNADRCTSSSGMVVNLNGDGNAGFANYSGIIVAANMTNAGSQFAVTGYYVATLMNTITAGNVYIAGVGILTDNSAGATVTERTLPSTVWDELADNHTTAGTFGAEISATVIADSLATSGSTDVLVKTSLTQADGFYDGMYLQVINSAGTAVRKIDSYTNADGAFHLNGALPFTPSIDDPVMVLSMVSDGRTGLA